MSDGHKSCILAAENEKELECWISSLNTVLVNAKNASENNKKPMMSPESSGKVNFINLYMCYIYTYICSRTYVRSSCLKCSVYIYSFNCIF